MNDVTMSTLIHCAAMLQADIAAMEKELRKVRREIRARGDDDIAESIRQMARHGGHRNVGDNMQAGSGPDDPRNPGVDTAAALDRAQETGGES